VQHDVSLRPPQSPFVARCASNRASGRIGSNSGSGKGGERTTVFG
jgi:hypothetical protein